MLQRLFLGLVPLIAGSVSGCLAIKDCGAAGATRAASGLCAGVR